MKDWFLLLRWSWRDLRKYWVKVIAIALVIGIGTGAYAGMTSLTNWRRDSNNASVDLPTMYDMRFELAGDSFVARGDLEAAVSSIPGAASVTAAEERLVRPIQVDASTDSATILVPGLMVGRELGDRGPTVNAWHIEDGGALAATDSGEPKALLEYSFLQHNDLPATGDIIVWRRHVIRVLQR